MRKGIKSLLVKLSAIALGLIVYLLVMFMAFVMFNRQQFNPGVALVKLMYEFSTPAELAVNQVHVRNLLSEEDWERLQLDNPLRVTNSYQKFGYSASAVEIMSYSDTSVVYTIRNAHIDPNAQWVLTYEYDAGGKLIFNVREYSVQSVMGGGYNF